MSFLVTARKWRPTIFDEVVGQSHITQTLKNAITNNRIAHSYIFAGPRGVGKTTTARILAKSLNCMNPKDAEPCGVCDMCKLFNNQQSLDVIEIDGASNRRIEEIRTLRESVKYAPTKGEYKVYIIDEVHMLTTESFNALLKTLEEPPEHTIFIFATTDIHKVPLTIISRCQRFDFRRIELGEIKTLLKKIADAEDIKIDDQSLTLIAKKADGALRDAQSLFDQVISFCGNNVEAHVITKMLNLIDEEVYFVISDAIINKNFADAFDVSKKIYENGWNFIDFVDGLIEHFRNIMTVLVSKDSKLIESAEIFKEKYRNYNSTFSEGDILRILSFLNKLQYEIKNTRNQRLTIEIALTHLIGLERTSTISEIITKINSGAVITSEPQEKKKHNLNIPSPGSFQKEEIKKTNLAEKEKPVKTSDESTTDNVHSLWKLFVEKVHEEKFTLGLLANAKLVNVSEDKIFLKLEHPEDEEIIQNHSTYLYQKTKEIFGKKYEFIFDNHLTNAQMNNTDSPILKSYTLSGKKPVENEHPLIRSIITELGGREV
ncbi:MAG: DNA polymerase III, subunit gamma and tau [Ignavibacteria bacterium GWB2_35_12]|nr:MAG: DNA polymerase III, subunit gamma and tau [Ignavibacteria bacterium GWB2_35_12]